MHISKSKQVCLANLIIILIEYVSIIAVIYIVGKNQTKSRRQLEKNNNQVPERYGSFYLRLGAIGTYFLRSQTY